MFVRYVCKVIGTDICILLRIIQNSLEIDPTPITMISLLPVDFLFQKEITIVCQRHRMLIGIIRNLSHALLTNTRNLVGLNSLIKITQK